MALCSSRLKELTSLTTRLPPPYSPPPPPPQPSPLHIRNSALLDHLSRILVTMAATVTDLEKTVSHKAQIQTSNKNNLATLLSTYTQLLNQLNGICTDICLPMNSGETGMEVRRPFPLFPRYKHIPTRRSAPPLSPQLHHYKIIVDEIRREVTSKERVTAADNVSLLYTSKIVVGDVTKVPIGVRFTLAVKRREAALKAQAERRKNLYSGGEDKKSSSSSAAPNSGGNSRVMQSPLFANPTPRSAQPRPAQSHHQQPFQPPPQQQQQQIPQQRQPFQQQQHQQPPPPLLHNSSNITSATPPPCTARTTTTPPSKTTLYAAAAPTNSKTPFSCNPNNSHSWKNQNTAEWTRPTRSRKRSTSSPRCSLRYRTSS